MFTYSEGGLCYFLGMSTLDVYVTADCFSCQESRRIVADLIPQFRDITIMLHDLTDEAFPDDIFAVPTYMINGKVIFIGNPQRQKLLSALGKAPACVQS